MKIKSKILISILIVLSIFAVGIKSFAAVTSEVLGPIKGERRKII